MRLDFNETNILIQAVEDLKSHDKPVNKSNLVALIYELLQNTDKSYVFVRQATKSLAVKIEQLSENNIEKIFLDVRNNSIVATAGYVLPG